MNISQKELDSEADAFDSDQQFYKHLKMSAIETRSITVSLTVSLFFLFGGGVLPFFIGLVGDMISVAFGITVVGGMIVLGAILPNHLKYLSKI